MSADLDFNAAISGLCLILKAQWGPLIAIHEAGMAASINAGKFPFAALEFEPAPIQYGGDGAIKAVHWTIPVTATYIMAKESSTKDMDTARTKLSSLAKVLLDSRLPWQGDPSCTRILSIQAHFGGSERFLALALERQWPVIGVSLTFDVIGIER